MTTIPIHRSQRLPMRLEGALIAGILLGAYPGLAPRGMAQQAGQDAATHATEASIPLYAADRHYGGTIDRQLWLHPWAHGYQHGYEDGFHRGEWAHQMFEHPGLVKNQTDWKHADRGYQAAMGDRDEFRRGYRTGFQDGYEDAYSGHAFQALNGLQQHDQRYACLGGCRPALAAAHPAARR